MMCPTVEAGSGLRDLRVTTPQQLPLLSFQHRVMQETLLGAAEGAGAEVRRGVSVERIECGAEPAAIVDGHSHERIPARLVVAADGRAPRYENGRTFQFANKSMPATWLACC